jgi:hypothetical protein
MIPCYLQNPLVSGFKSISLREQLAAWQGYKAALIDVRSDSSSELEAMADIELGHLRREIELREEHLPKIER